MSYDPNSGKPIGAENKEANTWAMALHLSQLGNYVVPFSGFIAPIVIWQLKKNDIPNIDAHGKIVANWLLSAFIYGIIAGLLVIVVVGIFLLPILAIVSLIYAIVGGIKANQGEIWKYPGSIPFFK
jgi:uncharacterized Tic20 family protein